MSSKIEITKVCQHCGIEFTAKTTVTQFCSHTCASRNYKKRKRIQKVTKVPSIPTQKKEHANNQFQNKEYLSIADTCQLLGASRMTIYRNIKNGTIQAAKLGKRTIIKKTNIEKLFTT